MARSGSDIPWLRLAAEGVAIVLSILLAFSIDAGWDLRREAAEEREILLGLEAEFDDLRTRLESWTGYNRAGVRLVDQVLSDSISRLRRASVDSALVLATVVNVLDQGGALEALLASGRLEMISDRELRARLAKWPDWLEDIHTNDLSFRDFAFREVAPFLAARGWPSISCEYRVLSCAPPGPIPASYLSLSRDPEFRALMIWRKGMMRTAAVDHSAALQEAEELLVIIRDHLSQ